MNHNRELIVIGVTSLATGALLANQPTTDGNFISIRYWCGNLR